MLIALGTSVFTEKTMPDRVAPANEPEERQPEPSPRCAALRQRIARDERDRCVIFYHVPKTAGASYRRPAGWDEWSTYAPLPQRPPPELQQDWLFLRGHWTPGFKSEYLHRDCWEVTILRDPLMHALSAFYFHGHESSEWESCLQGRCARNMANGDACCAEQYTNGQTRQLAGRNGIDLYTGALGTEFPLPPEALSTAKANLQAMDLVGISEDRDSLARMLAIVLRVNQPIPEDNPAPPSVAQSISLPNVTLDAVRAANSDDAQLYELAQELAAADAFCLMGQVAALTPAPAPQQSILFRNATALVTISDDEAGLPRAMVRVRSGMLRR